jgi:hypothetical protein
MLISFKFFKRFFKRLIVIMLIDQQFIFKNVKAEIYSYICLKYKKTVLFFFYKLNVTNKFRLILMTIWRFFYRSCIEKVLPMRPLQDVRLFGRNSNSHPMSTFYLLCNAMLYNLNVTLCYGEKRFAMLCKLMLWYTKMCRALLWYAMISLINFMLC